ncbi:MAG: cytochrome c oxidase accessory protein CcoG [Gracilimonas sp.]|uniref:cytochrome c oxidase accessory protein CcoG n=1 Tax=Gracilimonas sp. TaxID=1974203 RepID=UPI003751E2B9|nr:cytochrome c oxidase accessory protein CcoG [Gracilimonas sp.]
MANLEEKRRIDKQNFRDHLATVNEEGKRNWIYPKKPSGRFYKARNVVAVLLLTFFFSGPFITINGNPLLLLNIIERKFVIFGVTFWPQDLHLLLFGIMTFILFIVLFTAVFGRVWCGWTCPQTIFMEMVFRRIEYWIEGDGVDQFRLNKKPWNFEKISKKVSKHAIFFGIAFLISNMFLAYIIGKDQLFEIITDPPSEHIAGLSSMIIFSGVFYGVFAFMREQVCHFVCPYGRMQSVMLDNNSINVMYDYVRGETRASIKDRYQLENRKATLEDLGFSASEQFGDCIDCYQCVKVCPMGIDIRNGTQLECVHCTACIDACDSVMDKIDKPRGLIRYSSENAIREEKQKVFTPRVAGYSGILLILLATFITLLTLRPDTETIILREPGTLYQELPDNRYANIYNVKILNKTFKEMPVEIRLESPEGDIVSLGTIDLIQPQNSAEGRFMVQIDQENLSGLQTELIFGIYSGDEKLETVTSGFLGPGNSTNN